MSITCNPLVCLLHGNSLAHDILLVRWRESGAHIARIREAELDGHIRPEAEEEGHQLRDTYSQKPKKKVIN